MPLNYKCQKIIAFCLFLSLQGWASNPAGNLNNAIDTILVSQPKKFKEIRRLLKPFSRDTVQLKKIIKIFNQKSYLSGKVYAQNFLGICYRNYSMYDQAIIQHKQALLGAKKDTNIEFEVFSLNMLGVVYRRLEANLTAIDYHKQALALAEKVAVKSLGLKRGIAVSYNSIGNIYLSLEQYRLAIKQFKKSKEIEEEINNYLGLAINYQNVGYANNELGLIEEALVFYKKSLAFNQKLQNKTGLIICKTSIAEVFIKKGENQKAANLLLEVLPMGIAINDQYHLCEIYITLALAQINLGAFSKAEVNLKTALNIAEQYKFSNYLSKIFLHKSALYGAQNKNAEALTAYRKAIEYDKKIRNNKTLEYVNDLMIKYESEKKSNQIEQLGKQNQITKLKLERIVTFALLGVFLLIGISVFIYFFNKQKILGREKKILVLEQDVLRARMNPHFIFNALNSIKLYIIDNNQKNAVLYLNKFSKLMRKTLEASGRNLISLEEELAVAKLYVSIENTRFSKQVDYIEDIISKIDLNTIWVPPLVLQPFLENSLWHGLSLKKGKKKILLTVIESGSKFIEIRITDNGIGRLAAQKIKSKKIINSKSIGLKLTEERLQNHAIEHKKAIHLDVVDLYDSFNKSIGTKVILKLEL